MSDTRGDLGRFEREWVARGLNRRHFVKLVAGGTSAAFLTAFMAACGGSSATPTTASSTSSGSTTTTSSGGTTATTGSGSSSASPAAVSPANIATNVTLTMPIVTTLDVTLDPQATQNYLLFYNMFDYIYGGLVKFDKDAHVIPDLAERWDKSSDGLTYTFHIRSNAKFASGRQVTADDFIYSWKRALNPKKPAPASFFMESLKGATEYTKGTATELTGATKIDDSTVQVTLTKPINYFLAYLATIAWYVVDKDLIEKYGDDSNSDWTNHQPYGTGAWKVNKFDPATGIELVPNENYWGQHSPSVTKLEWPILKGPTAANQGLNLYKANQADILSAFPLSLLDAVEQDFKSEIVPVTVGGVNTVAMSFGKKPFDNVLVRRAFAMAIDRNTFDNVIWRGSYTPTDCYEPPSIPNYTCAPGIPYDPTEAPKVLAAAGYPGGKGLPPIQFYEASDTSAEDVNRWRALADMWNKTLGANVSVNTSLTSTQIQNKIVSDKGLQMEIFGNINITDTPELMSEFLRSDSVYQVNRFDWGIQVPAMTYNGVTYDPTADAKKFDALMDQADVEQDATKRNQLYQQGEALFLRDAVFVPFGYFVYRELVKPKIKGLDWGGFYYSFPRSIEGKVVVTKS
ncbi:MAG TPA: peptide ABC transporter substrate-binding protein [Thermomicrobiaceae bacterium]|nr:peptide ABC transporter substrate-binding protein [Thermomicrobiaceae bacterium]